MRLAALAPRMAALALAVATPAAAAFDHDFTGATMRLDLFHTGNAEHEILSVERLRVEGAWPGSRTQLLDTANLGKYRFEIVDLGSQRVLYSRGYASIYGEWETTAAAQGDAFGTLTEAIRFPEPRRPFQVRLQKRAADLSFREIWTATFDPAARSVDRSPVAPQRVWPVFESGDPAVKVDLLFLGDGYAAEELDRFHEDVRRLSDALFGFAPFAGRRTDFNVRAIDTPAALSGISRPRSGLFRASPLGASYNAFDSERYVLALDDRAWRDVAAAAPYDAVILLLNSEKYGGGGIYGLYSTAAAGSGFADYLVVHEFGHHFAGLGDEYYTSPVAYQPAVGEKPEPWEPNVTALHDPAALKWRDLVAADTPLPTPWDKQGFETESRAFQQERAELRAAGAPEAELEELFRREREQFAARLGGERWAGAIGAFEGASYEPQGLYRPAADCVMFTRTPLGFCAVCQRAIERVIDLYTH